MNRTDRLLAILLELQAKRHQRAEDLAATFEVSKRTIYRDMLALSESGVPLISEPGKGYSLLEGYFLPPLSFSTDEALILLLGSDVAAQNFDAQYRAAAQSAHRKISAVVPPSLRDEVADLQRSLRFIGPRLPGTPELLQQLRRAIIQRRTVEFDYQGRFGSDSPTRRQADPYALIHVGGAWYLQGYCHLRHDTRTFRLNRMDHLVLLDATFVRPLNYEIKTPDGGDRDLSVQVLFDHETAAWVREAPSYFQTTAEATPDGWLVTLLVRYEDEIVQWLLGWGAHVRVLSPPSLQARLSQEARTILALYPETTLESV